MRFTSLEAHGLRCIVQLARSESSAPRGIADIANAEFLSPEYTAKMMRLLRNAGLTTSTRGAHGGYTLAKSAHLITAWHVIEALEERPHIEAECVRCQHSKTPEPCQKSNDCGIRSLWRVARTAVKGVLDGITIEQLTQSEADIDKLLFIDNPRLSGVVF